jgi:hypothetical protein
MQIFYSTGSKIIKSSKQMTCQIIVTRGYFHVHFQKSKKKIKIIKSAVYSGICSGLEVIKIMVNLQ